MVDIHNYLVSIIIPFYKGDQFLPVILGSLKKAIENCSPELWNFELIVVIDSPDTNLEVIQKIVKGYFDEIENISVIIEKNIENIGVAESRNKALEESKGSWIHIIDQDDAISADFYKSVLPFTKHSNFILTNGYVHYNNHNFNPHKLYYLSPNISIKHLILDDFVRSPGQIIFKKSLCKGIRFPTALTFKGADDKFFYIRIFLKNQQNIIPKYIKEPLYIAYLHDSNFSNDNLNLQKSALENWSIINLEDNLKPYQNYVKRNLHYLKYITGQSSSLLSRIIGFKEKLIYNLNLSKIIRYIIKRK